MANPIRIKRRSSAGAVGAPATLENAELAMNEAEDVLYYGKGTGGAEGSATSIIPIGGSGAFLTKTTAQTISGAKTFTGNVVVPTPTTDTEAATKSYVDNAVGNAGGGDMMKGTYDSNDDGTVDAADTVPWDGVQNKPTTFTPATHDHTISEVTGLQDALNLKAPLASPAFTGTPTAPTAATTVNNTQIASTAYVKAVVASLIDAAPGTMDTLNEIAAALGDDPDFATTITNNLAGKLAADFSNVTDPAAARTALGLQTMATQAASNVAITGGTIDGVTLDGGTF